MVRPWYLNGLEKSMWPALSGLIVRGATIMSASLLISSEITPFHFFSLVLLTLNENDKLVHQSLVFVKHSLSD